MRPTTAEFLKLLAEQVGDGLNAADLALFEVYSGKVYKLPKMDEKMEFASVVTPRHSTIT
jgi:hypothetical protein